MSALAPRLAALLVALAPQFPWGASLARRAASAARPSAPEQPVAPEAAALAPAVEEAAPAQQPAPQAAPAGEHSPAGAQPGGAEAGAAQSGAGQGEAPQGEAPQGEAARGAAPQSDAPRGGEPEPEPEPEPPVAEAPASESDAPQGERRASEPRDPSARDFGRPVAVETLSLELDGLLARAAARGVALERVELGRSDGGRPLELVRLPGAPAGPSLLVVTDCELEHPLGGAAGPEAALFLLEELAARLAGDRASAERLARASLEVLPLLEPDPPAAPAPRAAALAGARVNLNRNFPSGWEPWAAPGTLRLGQGGPFPLSEPESLALARHLLARPSLVAVVLLTRRPGSVLDEPGSLARYAARVLGIPVVAFPAWEGERVATAHGSAPQGFVAALERLLALYDELPRLELSPASVERLRSDLWQVELALERGGELWPRLAAVPGARRAAARLALTVEGARLELVGLRSQGQRAFLPAGEESLARALLERGTERLELRLALRAEEGSAVRVALAAALAGRGETRLELR